MNNSDLQLRADMLLRLTQIIRYYDEVLIKATGEQFNLFDILHVGHYEVRTHSPMLAGLLNPRGSHGQGAVFLKKFLKHFNIPDFAAESARVKTEACIGMLGRIDIVIEDGNNRSIFIENKIYADLQENQLGRYHEHNRKAKILYLTLNGENPSDWETNPIYRTESFVSAIKTISYRYDIIGWLETCRKEVATVPGVREAITQYIHLVQRLTQQNTSARMNDEIIKHVTSDSSNYLAYASLIKANAVVRKVIIDKINSQLDTLGKDLGLETLERFKCRSEAEENYFYTNTYLKKRNLRFGIRCSYSDYREFVFGFAYIDTKLQNQSDEEIVDRFKETFNLPFNFNGFWHASAYWQDHRDWDDETMAAIVSGKFTTTVKDLMAKLSEVGSDIAK